jgi:hypothetical protein
MQVYCVSAIYGKLAALQGVLYTLIRAWAFEAITLGLAVEGMILNTS